MGFFDQFKSQPEVAPLSIQHHVEENYPELFTNTVDPLSHSTSIMPYFWSTEDTKRAAIFSILPVGSVLVGTAAICQDQKYKLFLETTRKPSWAPSERWLYTTIDIATTLPLGYASYLVFKHGGGFEYSDTTLALSLYGANIVFGLATIPLLKQRNLKALGWNSLAVFGTALGAAVAFYKIDNSAGLWMAPYVLWTGFYAFLAYSTNQLNKEPKFD